MQNDHKERCKNKAKPFATNNNGGLCIQVVAEVEVGVLSLRCMPETRAPSPARGRYLPGLITNIASAAIPRSIQTYNTRKQYKIYFTSELYSSTD